MVSDQTTLSRPVSAIDPFSHAFLRDPYPHHEVLREAGPVVRLEYYGIWTMARHQEVRDALTDWQAYCSSAGVGLSDFRKEPPWRAPGIILEADPPPRRSDANPVACSDQYLARDVRARGGTSGRATGRAARIRRHCRSGRSLSAQSIPGRGRHFGGRP